MTELEIPFTYCRLKDCKSLRPSKGNVRPTVPGIGLDDSEILPATPNISGQERSYIPWTYYDDWPKQSSQRILVNGCLAGLLDMLILVILTDRQIHGHTRWNNISSWVSLVLFFLPPWLCSDHLKCSTPNPTHPSNTTSLILPRWRKIHFLTVLSFLNISEATNAHMLHKYPFIGDPLCAGYCAGTGT